MNFLSAGSTNSNDTVLKAVQQFFWEKDGIF